MSSLRIFVAVILTATGIGLATPTPASACSNHNCPPPKCNGNWRGVPVPGTYTLDAVTSNDFKDAWAAGTADTRSQDERGVIEHFDPVVGWEIVFTGPKRMLTRLFAVDSIPSDVWAVGSRGNERPYAVHTDELGTFDKILVPGLGRLTGVKILGANDVWAVGYDLDGPTAFHFDGSSWTQATLPSIPSGTLTAITSTGDGGAYAVGNSPNGPIALRFTGSTWKQVTLPDDPAGKLFGVTAFGPKDVWAVGTSQDHAIMEHFNGNAWSISILNIGDQTHPAVLTSASMIGQNSGWAVGYTGYQMAQDTQQPFALQLTNSGWNQHYIAAPGSNTWLMSVHDTSDSQAWAVGGRLRQGAKLFPVTEWYC